MSLHDALTQQHIELPDEQVTRLEQYCRLLWDWNEKINLTRHTDFEKFVVRDLLDSLAFARFLQPNEKVLDVGSGGGVPGVVLAILRPDLSVTLTESVGKKARVLEDIVTRLALPSAPSPQGHKAASQSRLTVFHGRAEDRLAKHRQDSLVIRAVAPLAKLLRWFQPYWHRFGQMLVLKGPSWVEERGEARHLGLLHDIGLRKLESYSMPGTGAESVLLLFCPKDRMQGDEEPASEPS